MDNDRTVDSFSFDINSAAFNRLNSLGTNSYTIKCLPF